MPAVKRVNTATLIRGKVYSYRCKGKNPDGTPKEPIRFELNKPMVIDDDADLRALEAEVVETIDGDGEVFEKPFFRIDRNVADPSGETNHKGPTKLSSTRTVRKARRRRA